MAHSSTPVIMHINYCEQGQSVTEAVEKAERWGFDGIELRGRSRQGVPTVEYIQSAIADLKRSKLTVPVVALGLQVDIADDAAVARHLDETLQSVKLLGDAFPGILFNAFSSPIRNPSPALNPTLYEHQGSAIATERAKEINVAFYREVADAIRPFDGVLAFETHGFYLHDSIPASVEFVERIDRENVGINFDLANQYYFPTPPKLDACVAGMKHHLKYVHLKNLIPVEGVRTPITTSLADGVINNRMLLKACRAAGYQGPVCIEAPRPGDREWFAQEDLAYLRALLESEGF